MDDTYFMSQALAEARRAYEEDEVPVGAVIVMDNRIIGRGRNMSLQQKDPTAHAEMLAIKEALKEAGGWRLPNCRIYVTIEPCAMCAGAIVLVRLEKLYIGAMDPKSGAAGSLFNIPQDNRLNHRVEINAGILNNECKEIMQRFFKEKRLRYKEGTPAENIRG